MKIFFNYTRDGKNWFPFNRTHPIMYFGGASEVGFTFDNKGDFYAVLRNEGSYINNLKMGINQVLGQG